MHALTPIRWKEKAARDRCASIELSLLVGFDHTLLPDDERTMAVIERDRPLNRASTGESDVA